MGQAVGNATVAAAFKRRMNTMHSPPLAILKPLLFELFLTEKKKKEIVIYTSGIIDSRASISIH